MEWSRGVEWSGVESWSRVKLWSNLVGLSKGKLGPTPKFLSESRHCVIYGVES